MTLGIRKLIVLVVAAALFLVANLVLVANWLQEKGVIDWAKYVHRDYLTGTAITIIVVLLLLLVGPRGEGHKFLRRCRVCEHTVIGKGSYCAECGSKLN